VKSISWRENIRYFLKIFPWQDVLLVGLLILFDISIHPLTAGPDRLIHDPAVYRLRDLNYLPGDWYTGMAIKSGVYVFYAKLVNAYQLLHLPEELWRQFLYLGSLAVLYYSLIRIARLFIKNILVVPLIALFVAKIYRPEWLYGPFIQLDGGLAPRSIGVAFSFLSLLFLLQGANIAPWALLGLASLIHVSNSLIVFSLFFMVWLGKMIFSGKVLNRYRWLTIGKQAALAIGVYLLAGGWFALYVASRSSRLLAGFNPAEFVWIWTYFRAPYLALPLLSLGPWLLFFGHISAIIFGWLLLRRKLELNRQPALNFLAFIGLASIAYFFIFYLFAFVWPWILGFQFYSIRVVYFTYFVAYLFVSLVLVTYGRDLLVWLTRPLGASSQQRRIAFIILLLIMLATLFKLEFKTFPKRMIENLGTSWSRLTSNNSPNVQLQPEVVKYLFSSTQPFLAPPDWNGSSSYPPPTRSFLATHYLPNIVTFKSFGFTKDGLAEWFTRINDVSRGEVQRLYQTQTQTGRLENVTIDWREIYSTLTAEEILALSRKYNFRLFVAYRNTSYPFNLVTEDQSFRLYQLPQVNEVSH